MPLDRLEKLNRQDAAVLLLWILAGIAGAVVARTYFYRAFPEANVEFKVQRPEALAQARKFATAQGAQLEGYDSSIVFVVDGEAKTYLEREVGLQQANQMMAGQVHLWFWQIRFFRPLQKEEYDVSIDPAGGMVGFAHQLEEAAPGTRLERDAAQAIAESFLRDTLHVDLSLYDFRGQEANPNDRPARRDWSFSWERRGFMAKEAPYRLTVSLAGDRVDGYREFLKVPEAWKIGYEHQRSSNNLFEFLALLPYGFLIGGCLYVVIRLGRRGLLDWRGGIAIGIFVTALYFVMTMNQWPLDRAAYDTNTPYSTFFLSQMGKALEISLASALLVVIAIIPGEPLYRNFLPGKLQLRLGLRLPGIRTKEFFTANVIGICMAAAHIGYITVFYIVSRHYGAWAPQDLNYEDMVSTYVPWVFPLTIGIAAATSEEFLFRLFAIPFLRQLTNSSLLAVVLPAFFWGFLHSNYPQEPAYIRGLEVGLIGIVAGLVMLRWGIWATLIWHYTVDAFLVSTSLLRTHGAYLRISGALVGGAALIPLAVAAVSYISRGGFIADESLLNSARPVADPAAQPSTADDAPSPSDFVTPAPTSQGTIAPASLAMSGRSLAILVGCGLAGIALLVGVKRQAIGDFLRFPIDARQAVERSSDALRQIHIDPTTYKHAATLTSTFDPYTNEYLSRAIGIDAANRVYREQVPSVLWTVRYFRDSQNEEYMVVLTADGVLHSIHHTVDEKTAGANLSREDAQSRAETFLRERKSVTLADWNLVESHTDKKPARTDHTFVWEQKASLDSTTSGQGAHIRMQLKVFGDEVSSYRIFIQIPEAWRDAEKRSTPAQSARLFGLVAVVAFAVIAALVIFFRELKGPMVAGVPWIFLGKLSIVLLLAGIAVSINKFPELLMNYTTAWPLATFYTTLGIGMLFIVTMYAAGGVILLGFSWFFLERAFGLGCIPSWRSTNASYFRDAVCLGIFGSAALMGLTRIPALFARWPLMRHSLEASVPEGLDVLNPAVGGVGSAIVAAFLIVGALGIVAGLIAAYVRPAWMRAALLILFSVLLTSNVATPGAFLREAAFHLFAITAIWFGITRLARLNVLGYFLIVAMVALASPAAELLRQPNPYFRANGIAVAAAALAILALPLVRRRAT